MAQCMCIQREAHRERGRKAKRKKASKQERADRYFVSFVFLRQVVRSFHDIILAYGQSDEYSFIFHENAMLFERRSAKLATSVATQFTAEYCMQWPQFFPSATMQLERPWPTFDGRCVCYPKRTILRDYLSWRQADCHVNNLYNTTFWSLVAHGRMTPTDAEQHLKGSLAADKNEILFTRFGINYNKEHEIYRKGTVIYRAYDDEGGLPVETTAAAAKAQPASKSQVEKEKKRRQKARIAVEHADIIGDGFWEARPYILQAKRGEKHDE